MSLAGILARSAYRHFAGPVLRSLLFLRSRLNSKAERTRRCKARWLEDVSEVPEKRGAFRIMIHAASVGEFEQAKPIIEALRESDVELQIVGSFFSSSGYLANRNYRLLDAAFCLPLDSFRASSALLDRLQPDLLVVMRYDLWPNLFESAWQRNLPVALLCATISNARSSRLPLFSAVTRSMYRRLAYVSAVDEEQMERLEQLGASNLQVDGDTRYDRVLDRVRSGGAERYVEAIRRLAGDRVVILLGSSWPEDEALLGSVVDPDREFLVIAPHEVNSMSLQRVVDRFPQTMLLNDAIGQTGLDRANGVVVDQLGILAELYGAGDAAWVGGGFGSGVHSLLEPAAHGLPLACGPRIDRSPDALALRKEGLLVIAEDEMATRTWIDGLESRRSEGHRRQAPELRFVQKRAGATMRVLQGLRKADLLPSSRS